MFDLICIELIKQIMDFGCLIIKKNNSNFANQFTNIKDLEKD